MGIFSYTAYDHSGKEIRGLVDADSPEAARIKLKDQGLIPAGDLVEGTPDSVRGIHFFPRVSGREVAAFSRQLSTLVGAGFSIAEALSTLSEQMVNVKFKQIIVGMRDRVREGKALSEVVREYSDVFPGIFSPMIKAGEKAGRLPVILAQLATYQARQMQLKGKVTAAIAYPLVMLGMAIVVIIFLMTWVVPTLIQTFEQQDIDLPLPTQMLIFMSDGVRDYWYLMIGLFACIVYGAIVYVRTETGRDRLDWLKLWSPIIGGLYRQIMLARFLRTFGILVRSDVPILTTIEILQDIVQNVVVERELGLVAESISKGSAIARPLKASGIFPPLVIDMIDAGQKSGQLDELVLKAAEEYEGEVETALLVFTAILEPVIIIVMGLVVGFIVLAIVLPLMNLSQTQS